MAVQTYRPTRAEINLANIAHNVREFRRHIPHPPGLWQWSRPTDTGTAPLK